MSESGRVAVFVVIALGTWTLMHVYVIARLWSVPLLSTPRAHRAMVILAVFVAISFPVAQMLESRGMFAVGSLLEAVGTTWMGVLFLLLVCFLVVDLATAFGHLFARHAATLRGLAAAVAVALSCTGVVIAMRDPVLRKSEVVLPGLPASLHGTTLVAITDLHLGGLLTPRRAERLATRVTGLRPDLVCVVGDVVEGGSRVAEPFLPILQRLQAPLGVWAVTGNHEFYSGLDQSVATLAAAGFHTLRDTWQQAAPGLVLAGVDDITARRQFGEADDFVTRALAGRPQAATILLSHTPWEVTDAARLGVGLMLSGHTHDGQIWPFGYLIKLRYPFLGGGYLVEGMHLLVCRGTGTWGPRMRLWRPSEILEVTLLSPEVAGH